MRLKYIIGILALLLLMVGTASAEETFYLTKTSETINGESVPGINISVTFNGTHIIVTDISSEPVVNPTTADIKAIRLYLGNDSISDVYDPNVPNEWNNTWSNTTNSAGFGEFHTLCDKASDNQKSRGPIIIALKQSSQYYNADALPKNPDGYSIIVHLGFGDASLVYVGDDGKYIESSWVGIPEFPTIALPVAAVLGLMFIFSRKKQE